MAANIGEMFYTGLVPWHGQGKCLPRPATVTEALEAGGLNWKVDEVPLQTAEDSPSPAPMRKALVRLDRPAGAEDRVLGVVHGGYSPIQNEDGAMLFDAIFARGQAVYETGGYLANGRVVWLLARLNRQFEIGRGDTIEPYALFCNAHDASRAMTMSLTTIRVVCQNTLSAALKAKRLDATFRRGHSGSLEQHAAAARDFFGETILKLGEVEETYRELGKRRCTDEQFQAIVETLFPEPKRPLQISAYAGLVVAYEKRVEQVQAARKKIHELRESGIGSDLVAARGTFWGALNAVTEFVDHADHKRSVQSCLFGDGARLKSKALTFMLDTALTSPLASSAISTSQAS